MVIPILLSGDIAPVKLNLRNPHVPSIYTYEKMKK